MITLLYWQALLDSERNVAKVVEFMGVDVCLVDLNAGSVESQIPVGGAVIARVGTLIASIASGMSVDQLRGLLSLSAKCVVYGFEPDAEHGEVLRWMTAGGLTGVEHPPDGDLQFSVEPAAADVCLQFAGLSFRKADPARDLTFVEGASMVGCRSLISIGKRPLFVATPLGSCEMLLLACRQVADLDEAVPRDAPLVEWFSRLAPWLMVLRATEGERCWHNDAPRACLIIDDPPLQKRYGFLDYEKLLDVMERERFSTCIAFIPWNYRRSSGQTVELFKRNPKRYSLCVHGCDHTGGEFGDTDLSRLQHVAREGLRRMARHQELAGVDFDHVMVFPQGCFSSAAMTALQSCNYLAAVNSSPFPVDGNGDNLRLRDLMDGAVTKFSGFPLFTRHYPEDLAGLAFALLLGKPSFLVEHHGYFRNGYAPLADVVTRLNRMEPRLEWNRPSVICSQACLKRRVANGDVHVRFYTDRFTLRHSTDETQKYVLFQRQTSHEPFPNALVNGVPTSVERAGDDLSISVELAAGQAAEVEVRRAPREPSALAERWNAMQQAGVFLRRHLSEFRDNYVDKNPVISRIAVLVRNQLLGKM